MLILKKGSRGEDVKRLQLLLNSAIHPSPKLEIDGDFGEKTEDAVSLFQQRHGLKSDGVVGPQTWTALGQRVSSSPKPSVVAAAPATQGCGDWMEIAKAEKGVIEDSLPGKHNERIVEYHSTTTLKATDDETPWCSSFVNWVMIQAGYRGTNNALAKSWLKWGMGLDAPRTGAITVIKKKNATSDQSTGSATGFHVGFLLDATSTHIKLLGGNQKNQVRQSTYSLSEWEVKGYRWPQ